MVKAKVFDEIMSEIFPNIKKIKFMAINIRKMKNLKTTKQERHKKSKKTKGKKIFKH